MISILCCLIRKTFSTAEFGMLIFSFLSNSIVIVVVIFHQKCIIKYDLRTIKRYDGGSVKSDMDVAPVQREQCCVCWESGGG